MTKIIFLGRLKDAAGVAERQVELPALSTSEDLIKIVAGDNDLFAEQLAEPSIRMIINKSILVDDRLPDRIEEVAFMPPLSGG